MSLIFSILYPKHLLLVFTIEHATLIVQLASDSTYLFSTAAKYVQTVPVQMHCLYVLNIVITFIVYSLASGGTQICWNQG